MKKIEENYSGEQSAGELADSYEGGEIIPIYTPEQFSRVGTGETAYVAETGKVYTYSADKTYMFYGQAEDITNVVNQIIEDKMANSSTSGSSGKATLLWDSNPGGATTDTSKIGNITVDNLSKYKKIYMCCDYSRDSGNSWITGVISAQIYCPIEEFTADTSKMWLFNEVSYIQYRSDTSIYVNVIISDGTSEVFRYKIYGIE